MTPAPRSLRARWVFPIDQPPLRDGVVDIQGESIVAVRAYRAGEMVDDLGDVAILPGLVNAHTHLEFSRLEQPLGHAQIGFADWIRQVIDYRLGEEARTGDPGQWRMEGVSAGVAETKAAGVAVVGEIATSSWPESLVNNAPLEFVVFAELLGMSPERVEPLWQAAEEHVAAGQLVERRWLAGLCPHAPYTVHPELIARSCRLSSAEHFPVAMHLAESLEEIELLQSGSGALLEFLESRQVYPRSVIPRGACPLDYLQALDQAERSLVVHGSYLSPEEIEYVGQRNEKMSVVYCPRTHAWFNAGDYPLAAMLAANVNVCLGTDSRASNPDLNLWEELRFVAHRQSGITPEGVLYLGTQAGADALGSGDKFGSLQVGKSSQLSFVTLGATDAADPYDLLFHDGTVARPVVFMS